MNKTHSIPATLIALAAMATLAACNTAPRMNARLDEAHSSYRVAADTPQTNLLAPAEMKQASDALALADAALARRAPTEDVDHLAYLASQKVSIAQEASKQKGAEAAVANASAARDKVRLAARTDEADTAKRSAMSAQQDAALSQLQAASSQQQASDAQDRNRQLLAQLKDLNAKQTARGVVITIGDVLFDTDRSKLKSGGMRNVEKLGTFLKANPLRKALIEGFTDSTGGNQHNQDLSGRRADAVRNALIDQGVDGDRVSTQAYGEEHPVADNDHASGRQLNRRVEIILSDEGGRISPR